MGHVRFKISYSRAAIEVYKAVRVMEVLSLLEVTVYLGIYDMVFFFQFKKEVSTASDYSSKNKIRRRGKEKKTKTKRSTWPEHSVKTQRL